MLLELAGSYESTSVRQSVKLFSELSHPLLLISRRFVDHKRSNHRTRLVWKIVENCPENGHLIKVKFAVLVFLD